MALSIGVGTLIVLAVMGLLNLLIYILFVEGIWPFNGSKIKNPRTGDWVERPFPTEKAPEYDCGDYCGGLLRSPEVDDVYRVVDANRTLRDR